MAYKKNEYPDWVEQYRAKGKTIRQRKNGSYALYHVTSEYRKGEYPKQIQEYLGVITKEDGFIPKRSDSERIFIEYGLSHMMWCTFRRDIARRVFSQDYDLARIGIIIYIFGRIDPEMLSSSYLTYTDVEKLMALYGRLSPNTISKTIAAVENLMRHKIPDDSDRRTLQSLLMLCVVEPGTESKRKPKVPQAAAELMEQYRLKYK